jgi:molybdate transport system substrate-binding protein
MKKFAVAALLLLGLPSLVAPAVAETVTVFVAGAAKAALPAVKERFGQVSGHTVEASFDTVGALRDRVLKGERPDLVILSAPAVSALAEKGIVARDAVVELGRTGVGLAGRPDRSAPPVETPDQLRALLLGAASIGYADPARGATAGTLFAKALAELGLAESLKQRLKVFPVGVEVVAAVEQGSIEVGVSQATEILTHPVRFLGYLPEPYQSWTPYQAALVTVRPAARQLLEALKDPAAAEAFRRIGFQ